MSQPSGQSNPPRGRGGPSSRGGRGRGGRSRGKAARARGSTRGMRIPPEYLAEVIARREGRDPTSVNMEGVDAGEEDDDGQWAKYAPRSIVQQEVEEEEAGIPIVGQADTEAVEAERQAELGTRRVIALHWEKALQSNEDPEIRKRSGARKDKGGDAEDDVDHALAASLRAIAVRERRGGDASEAPGSKVIQIEWDAELESLQRDKAEAEARTALKQRFKNPASKGRGGSSRLRKPAAAPSEALKPEMEVLEDFLDDLLG